MKQVKQGIFFSRNTNVLTFKYAVYNSDVLPTDCFKLLGVFLDSKLYFQQQVASLFSHTV